MFIYRLPIWCRGSAFGRPDMPGYELARRLSVVALIAAIGGVAALLLLPVLTLLSHVI